MKNVKVVSVRELNSEKGEMYQLTLTQEKEGGSAGLARRLAGIFSKQKPKYAFVTVGGLFIDEIEELLSDAGRAVDIRGLAQVDMTEEDHFDLPEEFQAKIVTIEFTEGEEIPEQYRDGTCLNRDAISDKNVYQVRTWEKDGEIQTRQPKMLIDENGDKTIFKKDGKNIYSETFLWIDGDGEEAKVDKLIQHDREKSNFDDNVKGALKERLNKRVRTVASED